MEEEPVYAVAARDGGLRFGCGCHLRMTRHLLAQIGGLALQVELRKQKDLSGCASAS